jgi:hypothetical protein
MDREKLVAAMRQEVQQIIALQTMLKNVAKAEEQGIKQPINGALMPSLTCLLVAMSP